MKKFPKNFIFSTSTCSYQIEGGRLLGGRKYSNWDKFTIDNYYIPPKGVAAREIASIEIAADYYNRYEQDSDIMKEIGVNGFAYNLDWARVFPEKDKVNEEGLQFYENMFKSLNKNGIKPIPILYHWDTPLWLEELGGTSSRAFLDAFRKFAKIMFERLGKYTDIWYVNDENSSYTTQAYLDDYCPPGKKNEKEFWKAIYYLSISGAIAKEEFEIAKKNKFISKNALLGIDHDWNPPIAYDPNDKDDLKSCEIFNEYNLDLFLDPNILGIFPKCFYNAIEKHNLDNLILKEDLELLKNNTLDLIGWNYYRPAFIANPQKIANGNIKWHNSPQNFITKEAYIVYPVGKRYTSWNWLIKPDHLSIGAHILWKKYKKPLMILENGIGYFDKKKDNIVEDDYRIEYLNEHLREVQKALDEGVPFIGYSLWTYCDIFSPSGGYRKKYGLVGVDFENKTLSRYPKGSMFWYKDVITNLTTFENDKLNYQKYYEDAKNCFNKKKNLWK